MTPHVDPEPSGRPGILTMPDALHAGLTRDAVASRVRRGRLDRAFRGTYVDPGRAVDDGFPLALHAAAAHLGVEACAVIASALRVYGIDGVVGDRLPEFALPPGLERRQRPGVVLHFWEVHPADIVEIDGLNVTSPIRTLADACRLLPRLQAVSCLDSALHKGVVTLDDLSAIRGAMSRRPGCVSGRRRLLECRPGAQSPLETRVRLRADDAGMSPDALQVPIVDADGVLLGYGDMGFRLPDGNWLIVEADGHEVHELPEALLHDRRRQNAFLASAGARIVRFTWDDTAAPSYIPSVLRPLLSEARWRPSPRPS